jgi:hypothetical protein
MTRLRLQEEKPADSRWMARASCVGHTALPWTENLSRVPEVLVDIMRDLCDACPVRAECAAYAVEVEITAGWWAGRSLNGFKNGNPPTAEDLAEDLRGEVA